MASSFSANQYERAFNAKSLCNWEVPKWYPQHPQRRTCETKFISNERGHLLPHIERPKSSPWGQFKGTWQLPGIITRKEANELNKTQVGGSRWAIPEANGAKKIKKEIKEEDEEKFDFQSFSPEDKEETLKDSTEFVKISRKFTEKEKLNHPIAISQQGRRAIRHETLERDNDEH